MKEAMAIMILWRIVYNTLRGAGSTNDFLKCFIVFDHLISFVTIYVQNSRGGLVSLFYVQHEERGG